MNEEERAALYRQQTQNREDFRLELLKATFPDSEEFADQIRKDWEPITNADLTWDPIEHVPEEDAS